MKARTLKANFAINTLGAIVPLIVALVTVPIYMRHIGDARYGVLSLVWVLLGYFGFLDLGLSRAAANALARLRGAPQEARARVLVTALVLNFGFGLFGCLGLAFFGSYLLQHFLVMPEVLKQEIADAFPWIVGLFPLALISGVGIGALESREHFLVANMLQVSGASLGQIVPVVLAVTIGPSLAIIIPAAVITRALTVITILVVIYRHEGPWSLRCFDRHQAKRLLSYGGWVTVTGLTTPILQSADQFLIGSFMGVASVAHYAVPMNLVVRSQIFPAALVRTLFPRMSNLGPEEARRLASRAIVSSAYGYAAICAPAIILAPTFFRYWIGADFSAFAAPVAEILLVGGWVNGVAFVPFGLLQSQGRPHVTGVISAAEIIPFICVLWVLTSAFGIVGAAIAWSLRCVVDAIVLFFAARVSISDLLWMLVPLAVLAGAAILGHAASTTWQALSSATFVGVLCGLLCLVVAEDLRQLAFAVVARLVPQSLFARAVKRLRKIGSYK